MRAHTGNTWQQHPLLCFLSTYQMRFFSWDFYMRIFLLSTMIEILLKVSWKPGLSFTDNVHITVAKTH